MTMPAARCWLRRARPLLGTLVEVGLLAASSDGAGDAAAFEVAFDAIREAQLVLSRFDAGSDIARFHALARGASMPVRPALREVLTAARELHEASDGAFDISLGSAPDGWRFDGERLHKRSSAVRLDLGGIGKGHAVDLAVQALQARGGHHAGWVNAGGDLRAFGAVAVPVGLRDEVAGGVRPFGTVQDGAFATSRLFVSERRCAHVSVAAPRCLIADALTKVVALRGEAAARPLLARQGAMAWVHGAMATRAAPMAA